ncbi:MAG: chromate transporter [Candidatus Gastranaerophilales bacterium]|nr:chromate transporter [Candidatus Gastranaerophilales bacterium]
MPNFVFLFLEFVKVGLFTFGGGYASLPFLYEMIDKYHWFTSNDLTQMIAISGITPGPIGLNMATFAGFKTMGFCGALIASFALILPMIILTTFVFRFYLKFCESKIIKSILYVLRPTSCALILAVGLRLFYELVLNNDLTFKNINYIGLILISFLFILTFKLKRDPIIYMGIAALIGIFVKFC